MSIKIGPGGVVDIVTSALGAQRPLRLVAFTARADTGSIAHPMFKTGENPVAVIDMNFGRAVTSSFGGVVYGAISQIDTGGLGSDGGMSGHTMLAVLTDTGTAGL